MFRLYQLYVTPELRGAKAFHGIGCIDFVG